MQPELDLLMADGVDFCVRRAFRCRETARGYGRTEAVRSEVVSGAAEILSTKAYETQ